LARESKKLTAQRDHFNWFIFDLSLHNGVKI
jgi:hypothetical protein